MHKELMKLMQKKGQKPMDEGYKNAKMGMLTKLKGEMAGMMGDDMKGLKKVTVASPSMEGLKEGVDKAEDMLEEMPQPKMSEDAAMKDNMGDVTGESDYYSDMSAEDIDQMMELLQSKKLEMMKNKKGE